MQQQQAQQASEILDFAGITTESLTEKSLLAGSGSGKSMMGGDQRQKSGMNMALLKGKEQRRGFDPLSSKCMICKQAAVQKGYAYCQRCSYTKGICAMCGKKILDISRYKQKNI